MSAITGPLSAARNLDWRPTLEVPYTGDPLPLTGASISLQIRLYGGAAGSALATQNTVDFSDAAAPTTGQPDRRFLTMEPLLTRSVLNSLPGRNQPEAGDAQRFEFEFKITYADDLQDSLWSGDFFLSPGVNTL